MKGAGNREERSDFRNSMISAAKTLVTAALLLIVFLVLLATGQVAFFFEVFGWLQHRGRLIGPQAYLCRQRYLPIRDIS